ncbi:LysR family transcriptional regulator [Crenobacter sp. SG2305]|uniref:LysR family transcriptional regulator n=1 Tax=Crenobacter oryzisoli TaxID=3056844 RepID=UPI0025AACFA7|nr:LysR family transcriptional regulator [Crenobacter sp. SG2305]MDN0085266.1 LysR family transcriptional regulator [Crenobacter sp. SG2305]
MKESISPHLAVFVDVVEQQSFSAVARHYGVAPSSVARRIDLLEQQLASRLLHRTTHALKPTESGWLFYQRAKVLLAEIRHLQDDILSQQDEPSGVLRMDCPAPFGRLHLMPALAAFMQRYPALHVELVLTDSMMDLQGGRLGSEVDVALRIGPIENTRLVATVLSPQRRLLLASPDYLAHRGTPMSVEELAEHDCLSWYGPLPPGAWLFEGRRQLPANPRLLCNNSEALLDAALRGLGIVHLPTWLTAAAMQRGALQPLLVGQAVPERACIHALRQEARSSAKVSRLIEFLKEWFARPAWELGDDGEEAGLDVS